MEAQEARGGASLPAGWEDRLVASAREARRHAYAPYSGFAVGAAVLTGSGRVFSGCNVENASYGATLCAERVAAAQAVASGERQILAVAVVSDAPQPTPPCGICRQTLAEFGPRMWVLMDNGRDRRKVTLDELLPDAFTRERLRP